MIWIQTTKNVQRIKSISKVKKLDNKSRAMNFFTHIGCFVTAASSNPHGNTGILIDRLPGSIFARNAKTCTAAVVNACAYLQ